MLLWVALGWRLHPELLIFQHQAEVFINSGCLCIHVVSELIDMVVFHSLLSFKALVHGGDSVISSRLGWLQAITEEVASLSTVEAFILRVVVCAS